MNNIQNGEVDIYIRSWECIT